MPEPTRSSSASCCKLIRGLNLIDSLIVFFDRKTAVDNGWQFKMVEEGGMFLTDFEWAPHLAKNHVLSETPLVPGSKVVKSSGCNFHFANGILNQAEAKACV